VWRCLLLIARRTTRWQAASGTVTKGCTMTEAPIQRLAPAGHDSRSRSHGISPTHPRAAGRRVLAAALTGALGMLLTWPAAAQVSAQVPAPLVGDWKGTWQTENRLYEARLIVTPSGGTWQTATSNRANVCAGREVPMKVETATESEVRFQLQFSEVINGCPNVFVTMKVGPDGAVTGTRSKYELQLVRKP
jgi:hypothetical protein